MLNLNLKRLFPNKLTRKEILIILAISLVCALGFTVGYVILMFFPVLILTFCSDSQSPEALKIIFFLIYLIYAGYICGLLFIFIFPAWLWSNIKTKPHKESSPH